MDANLLSQQGSMKQRSALNELWEAPTSWDAISYDSSDRHDRTVKKVSLAIFLFLAGFGMLAGGIYLWYTSPGQGKSTALLVLGSICFIPGFYHTRVAYLAWRGVEGYSLNSIPDV